MKCYQNFNEIITLSKAHKKDGRSLLPEDLSLIKNGAIIFDDEKILWVGNSNSIPKEYKNIQTVDCSGKVLLPEIVDSHTHLVFGGNRAKEYSMRLNGADYQDIANSGGGILATMEKTITASADSLFNDAVQRIERINSYGVGTIEIKSGYGLTLESERKITNVIDRLKKHFAPDIRILNTYLAAHAVPGGFKNSRDYLDKIVMPLLNEFASDKVIDFVDIFHEEGYFDYSDSEYLFQRTSELGIKIKIHADEFNDNKGAVLASKYNAVSADHLLCTTADGVQALSKSQTVATLLPGTAFFLGKPLADARAFLDGGCKVALASDYNPGSSHCDNLLLVASISAKSLQINLTELWCAITLNASHALGLQNQGALIPGLSPRFSIFQCDTVDEITYSWGRNFSIKNNTKNK